MGSDAGRGNAGDLGTAGGARGERVVGLCQPNTAMRHEHFTDEEVVLLEQLRRDLCTGRARELRLAAGLSPRHCGRCVGISGQSILYWENHSRRPCSREALRYAALLRALREEAHR